MLISMVTPQKCNDITCEVPQCSVVGPILFLIYINGIYTSAPNVSFHLFSDVYFNLTKTCKH